MHTYFIAYIATAVTFLAIDALWLGVIIKDFMQSHLGELLREEPDLMIAAGFYLVYAIGIVIFAIKPALADQNWHLALIYGALFGFMCYGTYDMTNLATLKNWPVSVVVVDIAWGTFLTAFSAVIGYFAVQKFIQT
mgnify:CR=1 FL=1